MPVIGANWGRGKCPICKRPHQKDLKVIWVENARGKILEVIKLCSWCWIPLFVQMLAVDPDLRIDWRDTS